MAAPRKSRDKSQTEEAAVHPALRGYIAADRLSVKLLAELERIAQADSTVLVTGESGTGKDLAASVLHYLRRAQEPLVKIDCAALPPELFESELFGYEKGAFTGASAMKRGRLELAGEGTIMFDEVSSLTLPLQAKLLRVLEDRKFMRLGGTKALEFGARIVATSNTDLAGAAEAGTFRRDLYYRLNVVPVSLLPLRARRADIMPLAHRFLKIAADARGAKTPELTSGAARALVDYDYPGNIRELRNIMERVMLRVPATVRAEDVEPYLGRQSKAPQLLSLEEVEKRHIAEVLDQTRGKKGKAAEVLGISRKNLLEKRKKYGLDEIAEIEE
jgi:transcriptional regulator with PAS, ATPase and Fis domain